MAINGRVTIHLLVATATMVAIAHISLVHSSESLAANTTTTTTTVLPPTTITDTTKSEANITTTLLPPIPSGGITANDSSSLYEDKDIEEVKKIIKQHIEPNHGENRLALNKPTLAPQMSDFAPDSMEARVSDATTQFGLNFINNLSGDIKENVVISPLSLQNLLNMILLGTSDNSTTQLELAKVLGYDSTGLMLPLSPSDQSSTSIDRLKPHEAMRSVFQSILAATHLSVSTTPSSQLSSALSEPELMNTNAGSLQQTPPGKVAAHLQTSYKEDDTPLSGQLNLTIANLVLTNKDKIELKQEYENDLKTYYNVNVEQFSRETSGSEKKTVDSLVPLHERVNSWVKNMTQNQIEKLAEEGDLSDPDLIMVLLNAAHFKGRWLHTFNTKATYDKTFFNYGNEKDANKVKFMRQKGVFGYADFGTAALQGENVFMSPSDSKTRSTEDAETLLTEDGITAGGKTNHGSVSPSAPTIELSKEEARRYELTSKFNCSALMLPFSLNDGQELSMVLLLPTKRDGVAELQAALDGPALNEIYRSLSEQQVQIELPKFSFEASHDAKATLLKMGLKSIFRETGHFERMFDSSSVGKPKVDKVIHKAKINVDESGAEAAAASMASIVLRNFIRPPTPIFVADHPFLFIIRHNRSNMPLFMGRVSSL